VLATAPHRHIVTAAGTLRADTLTARLPGLPQLVGIPECDCDRFR